jgi:hypothetical protein
MIIQMMQVKFEIHTRSCEAICEPDHVIDIAKYLEKIEEAINDELGYDINLHIKVDIKTVNTIGKVQTANLLNQLSNKRIM